jgi:hypothetical protein
VKAYDTIKLTDNSKQLFYRDNEGWMKETCGNIELYEGWYPIELMYSDVSNNASLSLKWLTTDGNIKKDYIPTEYLRSKSSSFTIGAWIHPYEVEKDAAYTIFSIPMSPGYEIVETDEQYSGLALEL